MFTTDESYRGGAEKICDCCGQPSRRTWSMVIRDEQPYALFFAACYDHGDVRESWIDVVFGTWGEGTDYHDHVTFGCRFGPVSDNPLPAATAVDAALAILQSLELEAGVRDGFVARALTMKAVLCAARSDPACAREAIAT